MHQAFEQLQVGALLALQNPLEGTYKFSNQQVLQLVLQSIRKLRINLLEKFDGTQSKFQGFDNHIQLIFRLQLQ